MFVNHTFLGSFNRFIIIKIKPINYLNVKGDIRVDTFYMIKNKHLDVV